ncbi:hypothetical protein QC761_603365 [Podospora bellae-mahoneyi]|uniref:Uncharacterized protein n=1 Tax=Podospora bellae-mahoneyi TaxID=2093777 RepID=A0ABR0F8S5_9PEZI|nr:hypothetical protein QC761_603365 [Podospora bellae-mahoneyi]
MENAYPGWTRPSWPRTPSPVRPVTRPAFPSNTTVTSPGMAMLRGPRLGSVSCICPVFLARPSMVQGLRTAAALAARGTLPSFCVIITISTRSSSGLRSLVPHSMLLTNAASASLSFLLRSVGVSVLTKPL